MLRKAVSAKPKITRCRRVPTTKRQLKLVEEDTELVEEFGSAAIPRREEGVLDRQSTVFRYILDEYRNFEVLRNKEHKMLLYEYLCDAFANKEGGRIFRKIAKCVDIIKRRQSVKSPKKVQQVPSLFDYTSLSLEDQVLVAQFGSIADLEWRTDDSLSRASSVFRYVLNEWQKQPCCLTLEHKLELYRVLRIVLVQRRLGGTVFCEVADAIDAIKKHSKDGEAVDFRIFNMCMMLGSLRVRKREGQPSQYRRDVLKRNIPSARAYACLRKKQVSDDVELRDIRKTADRLGIDLGEVQRKRLSRKDTVERDRKIETWLASARLEDI